jgi:DNA-directed RNA polymerase specialized sigma24 family protein
MTDLSEDLRRLEQGDTSALANVYDQTSADGWMLAMCVLGEPTEAHDAMTQAYGEVIRSVETQRDSALSARAWVLSIVYDTAKALLDVRRNPLRFDKNHDSTSRPRNMGAARVRFARLIEKASGLPVDRRR